ncbi:MAG: RNA-directed DNA polymerase [Elainellaceae cyanobacterium]
MSLRLTDDALDWSLKHALTWSDTDIFPEIFEFHAISDDWSNIKKSIQNTDILDWKVRAFRRCLVPKHRFGFRISTQLDPLDFLVFTALIKEIGNKLEALRVPVIDNIVHSYRFSPSNDGTIFSKQNTYQSFQKASQAICDEHNPSHIVIADIADFFPRLYTHRIDNALDSALGIGHMHAKALKSLISHWAGAYSYGIPVGPAASRLIAEVTISDIDEILLSEDARHVRYSDDFRIFCASEAEAYKYLTLIARSLIDNHGLTLQQNKTKIIPVDIFRKVYLKENEKRELETLSERFHDMLASMGVSDAYGEIDYETLDPKYKKAIDELNLENILREHINEEEPDLSLLKFLLRRLGQIGDLDAIDLIFDNFKKFVPVIRETIEYLMKLDGLSSEEKAELGEKLINIYKDESSTASHLEYSRMYILQPFALDRDWNSDKQYIKLYNDALDDFSRREILLAMGRSKKDFWFRGRKQSLHQMTPWLRRAFIYAASCLPTDEYKHWIRGIDGNLDDVERAIASWARKNPIPGS